MRGNEPNVIALDGPGGVGKSSVGRAVAARLGYYFLSSGLIYRCMAWFLAGQGWEGQGAPDLAPLGEFSLRIRGDGSVEVNGALVRADLKSDAISGLTSRLSTIPEVRARSNRLQREVVAAIAAEGAYAGVVLEGRDIGTVVFPEATHKFFLTASDEIRAERRYLELRATQPEIRREAVLAALRERDQRDRTREVAPLKPAADAVVVDTSDLTLDQVVETILARLQTPRGKGAPA